MLWLLFGVPLASFRIGRRDFAWKAMPAMSTRRVCAQKYHELWRIEAPTLLIKSLFNVSFQYTSLTLQIQELGSRYIDIVP